MKFLLPLLASLAAFFTARHFGGIPESALTVAPPAAAERSELRGLARQKDRLVQRNCTSVAALEKLYRSGTLPDFELQAALRQAAAHDPEGTWDWVDARQMSPFQRADLLRAVAGTWFKTDPDAVLARLATAGYWERGQIAGSLIGQLMAGPDGKIAATSAQLDRILDLAYIDAPNTFQNCSAEGAAKLLALPAGSSRDRLLEMFAAVWLQRDPAASSAWFQQLPAGIRNEAGAQFAERALASRGEGPSAARSFAIGWLLKDAPAVARARLGATLADTMAETDPAAALKWANENLSARPLAEATGKVIARILASDPEGARQMVASLPPGNSRNSAANGLAGAWITKEPAAAVAWWLQNIAEEVSRDTNYGSPAYQLGSKWGKSDPQSFRDYFADPAATKLPDAMIRSAMKEMMANREATFDWLATLPAEGRGPLIKAAYHEWVYTAPVEAAAAFDSRPELANGDVAQQVATGWYRSDPRAAVGWVSKLPWGGVRESAIAGLKKMAERKGGSAPEDLKKLLP
ncbi:hypothetical protein [Luteolibacter sp. Populi]|uniref:hypothetical protein n=1 Tax=Luteolibacter sp. Populi TaxID=3230487 RepID=UPI0034677748